jgi:hypothetical protein
VRAVDARSYHCAGGNEGDMYGDRFYAMISQLGSIGVYVAASEILQPYFTDTCVTFETNATKQNGRVTHNSSKTFFLRGIY